MFELVFGIIWTLFSLLVFGVFLATGAADISVILFIGLFVGIGILLIVTGVKEIIRNSNTEKNGEECFAKIVNVKETGSRVNEEDIYKAIAIVYIGSEGRIELVSEKIGFNPMLYPIGSYVKVKYYLGDINFINGIDDYSVPSTIREILDRDENNVYKGENNINKIDNYANDNYNELGNYVSPEIQAKIMKVAGVIIILVALFLLLFMGLVNFIFSLPADEYYVNGELVTQEEFLEATSVSNVIIGIFSTIGIIMMIVGIKLCLTKVPTDEEIDINKKDNTKNDAIFKNNNYNGNYSSNYNNCEDDDPIRKF